MKPALLFLLLLPFPLVVSAFEGGQEGKDSLYQDSLDSELLYAAWKGHKDTVLLLLDSGAQIDAIDPSGGQTALVFSAQQGHLDVVVALLHRGADPNIEPKNQATALIRAAHAGFFEVCEELIRYGAQVDYQDNYGWTPLHFAAAYGYYYLADMLLYYGASINIRDSTKSTPLIHAIGGGYPALSELLINRGAHVHIKDDMGVTPLMVAAHQGFHKLCAIILEQHPQTEDTTAGNHTALTLSVAQGHITTTDTLIRYGANINHQLTPAITPLTFTRLFGDDSLQALLKTHGALQTLKPLASHALFSYSINANTDDALFGTHAGIHEAKSNTNITLGFSARYFAKRVLEKQNENTYYQYWERRYMVPLKADKLFDIHRSFDCKLAITAGVMPFYSWGRYRGTGKKGPSRWGLGASAGLLWKFSRASAVTLQYEYIPLDQITVSPHRIGVQFILHKNLLPQIPGNPLARYIP